MNEEGFTLIELVIVVVIVGILASIGLIVYNNQQEAAVDATLQSGLRNAALSLTTESVKNGGEWGDALPEDYTATKDNVVELASSQEEPAEGWNESNGGVLKQQGIYYKDWGDTFELNPASTGHGLSSSINENGELVITTTNPINLRRSSAFPGESGVLQFNIPEDSLPTDTNYANVTVDIVIEADIGETNTSLKASGMSFVPRSYNSGRMNLSSGENAGDMFIKRARYSTQIGPKLYLIGNTTNPTLYPGESLTVKKASLILEPVRSQNITPIYEAPPTTGPSECVQAYNELLPDRVWHYNKAEGKVKEGSC